VLLKVKNRTGAAGFALALSRRDGKPIEGLRVDASPKAVPPPPPAAGKPAWKEVLDHAFRAKGVEGRLDVAVGRFKAQNRRLVGEATDGRVEWRKYSVRPGFPSDRPSNLLWVKSKTTEGLEDLRVEVGLVPPTNQAPKVAVTLQGDGGTDGLGGWTLVLHPAGEKKVAARLERYEDLAYQLPPTALPESLLAAEEVALVLALVDDRLTVSLGDLVLFRSVSLRPIAGRHRVGLATWGPDLGVSRITLAARPEPARGRAR
jgi:hypothetical protein